MAIKENPLDKFVNVRYFHKMCCLYARLDGLPVYVVYFLVLGVDFLPVYELESRENRLHLVSLTSIDVDVQ